PFVFRTIAPSPGPPPATASFAVTPIEAGVELTVTVVPKTPGLAVIFAVPDTLAPARSNLPGRVQGGLWRARYVAIPADGVTWRASFKSAAQASLPAQAMAILTSSRFPGGTGWQSLPAWLPQQNTVWHLET